MAAVNIIGDYMIEPILLHGRNSEEMKRGKEETMEIIRRLDKNRLNERADRLNWMKRVELGLEHPHPPRLWYLLGEADNCYIYGLFRNAIFAYATCVDQIFQYEFAKITGDVESILAQFKIESWSFGRIIKQVETDKIPQCLLKHLDTAKWLNKARNDVAVHPIGLNYVLMETEEDKRMELIKMDLFSILNLFEGEDRKAIEQSILDRTPVGGEELLVRDILEKEEISFQDALRLYQLMYEDIIADLAFAAQRKTRSVINDLYKDSRD